MRATPILNSVLVKGTSMKSTMTVISFAHKVLSKEVNEAINLVEVRTEIFPSDDTTMSVDDLGRKHLPAEVDQTLRKFDAKSGAVGMGVKVKELEIYVGGQGLSLLIIVLVIAQLLMGAGNLLELARSLLGP